MRRIFGSILALIVAAWAVTFLSTAPAEASTAGAATLAAANIGKSAGICAYNPTTNSLGGSQFEHSCSGVSAVTGRPKSWTPAPRTRANSARPSAGLADRRATGASGDRRLLLSCVAVSPGCAG